MQISLVRLAVSRGRLGSFADQKHTLGRFAASLRHLSLPSRGRSTVWRHENFGVADVEPPAHLGVASGRFTEADLVDGSIGPHAGPFPPEWSLGVGGWASVESAPLAEPPKLPSPSFFSARWRDRFLRSLARPAR